jgi:hypothetical protein
MGTIAAVQGSAPNRCLVCSRPIAPNDKVAAIATVLVAHEDCARVAR